MAKGFDDRGRSVCGWFIAVLVAVASHSSNHSGTTVTAWAKNQFEFALATPTTAVGVVSTWFLITAGLPRTLRYERANRAATGSWPPGLGQTRSNPSRIFSGIRR